MAKNFEGSPALGGPGPIEKQYVGGRRASTTYCCRCARARRRRGPAARHAPQWTPRPRAASPPTQPGRVGTLVGDRPDGQPRLLGVLGDEHPRPGGVLQRAPHHQWVVHADAVIRCRCTWFSAVLVSFLIKVAYLNGPSYKFFMAWFTHRRLESNNFNYAHMDWTFSKMVLILKDTHKISHVNCP